MKNYDSAWYIQIEKVFFQSSHLSIFMLLNCILCKCKLCFLFFIILLLIHLMATFGDYDLWSGKILGKLMMFGFAINIAILESGVKMLKMLPYHFLWKRHIRLGLLSGWNSYPKTWGDVYNRYIFWLLFFFRLAFS